MRTRIASFVVLVALVGALVAGGYTAPNASADEHATSGEFSALAYNVAGLPSVLSGLNPEEHTPLISPLLNDYDLVLVQESWINPDPPLPGFEVFHEALVADVTHPYLSVPAPPPLGTNPDRPSALVSDGLNRMSVFPFDPDVTRVMWPSCFGGADTSDGGAGDCLSEKGFSFARTELAPGVEVDVYNLHAEAGNTPADWEAREEGYEVLAAFIDEHSAGRAVIVGGDYNLHTHRPEHHAPVFAAFLEATGLTDVCEVVDCGSDDHRIDKFTFRSGGGVILEPLDHRFEYEKFSHPVTGEALSDHDALAVDFAWSLAGSISGRVVDGANQPLPGAAVWAYADDDVWIGTGASWTAADGTYAIEGLPAGEYRVMFRTSAGTGHTTEWWHHSARRATAAHVAIDPGGIATGIDGKLVVGGTVTGTVIGPDGAREGVQVWAYADTDRWVGTAATRTAVDGTYVLDGLPAGSYRIMFRVVDDSDLQTQWWVGSPTRAGGAHVSVDWNHLTSGIDAQLAPPVL